MPLQGHVVDAATGLPIHDFSVKAEYTEDPNFVAALYDVDAENFSTQDGCFSLKLPVVLKETLGTIAVHVTAEGYDYIIVDPVYVLQPENVPLTIKMSKGKPITGCVVNEKGVPAANAEVAFVHHEKEVVLITGYTLSKAFSLKIRNITRTNAEGCFQLQHDEQPGVAYSPARRRLAGAALCRGQTGNIA